MFGAKTKLESFPSNGSNLGNLDWVIKNCGKKVELHFSPLLQIKIMSFQKQELAHLFASNVFSVVALVTMLMALLTCPCLWKADQDDCFVVVVGVDSDEGLM